MNSEPPPSPKRVMSYFDVKPSLRGTLHKGSFYFYLSVASLAIIFSKNGLPRLAMTVYLLTLLCLYGISSILHLTPWKTRTLEIRVQNIDHASIFLLIAGTYTPIGYSCIPMNQWSLALLFAVWMSAILGVIKCLFVRHLPKSFNVTFYCICGLTVVPFIPVIREHFKAYQIMLAILGGAFYIVGGIIFALEYPDPYPSSFGYHEIFHLLTVLGNLCFVVTMLPCTLSI